MTMYMAVTRDEFELPLVVADSVQELAKMIHRSPNSLYHAMSLRNGGCRVHDQKARIVKVKFDG